jgi:hypothetical protein
MDNLAIKVLNTIGISVPDALFGSGDIDAESAKEIYYELSATARGGTQELYREAAKWLVYGTKNFDPCNVPENTTGPFMEQCIQREFRKAGCQPAGSDYPSKAEQFGKYAGYKWSDIRKEFKTLHDSMSDEDGNVQDEAVQKCLGVTVKRGPEPPCELKHPLEETHWRSQYTVTVQIYNIYMLELLLMNCYLRLTQC